MFPYSKKSPVNILKAKIMNIGVNEIWKTQKS